MNEKEISALQRILDTVYAEKFYMTLFIGEQGLTGEYTKWLHEKTKHFNNLFGKRERGDDEHKNNLERDN